MQRVRIGLTGLAFVFVLVLLAAIFTRPTDEQPITANSIDRNLAGDTTNGIQAEPKEPLAELGMAPGGDTNNISNQAAQAPVAR